MATPSKTNITDLLIAWRKGDEGALDRLLPRVYDELRRQAARHLRRERVNHTLQPTALVHEVYLRLIDREEVPWQNRTHFFGIAARLMREILIDHARAHGAAKRAALSTGVTLD